MCLFVCVDLPPALTESVAAVQSLFDDPGASGLSNTDPVQAHFTLKFLGTVDEDRCPELTETLQTAVDAAAVAPFECTVGGLGVFRSSGAIRVVWAGVRNEKAATNLRHLAEAVEAAFVDTGFAPERHAFTPHVTIARGNDSRGEAVAQTVLTAEDPTVGTFHVDAVQLTESRLSDDGPAYRTVADCRL